MKIKKGDTVVVQVGTEKSPASDAELSEVKKCMKQSFAKRGVNVVVIPERISLQVLKRN